MASTTERFDPTRPTTAEDRVMGLFHRYAYEVAAASIEPGARVLDVGFGEGYGAEILGTPNYLGVEVDEKVVARARSRHPRFHFASYDGRRLPPGPFDLAISFQVIEHVDEPEPWLDEIARVSRRAMFTTPNRIHRVRDGERPWNRYHVREFLAEELRALLAAHFDDVVVYGVSARPEIEAVELARVARARKIARLDPLGLRYRLPEAADAWVRRKLRRPPLVEGDERFDLADLQHSEAHADSGIDLLAIVEDR